MDLVLCAFRLETTLEERNGVFRRYVCATSGLPHKELHVYRSRHDNLRILAWLIEDWPNGGGSPVEN